jgi:hypothetical protein
MSAFTDLLERHVPYASTNRDGVVCLECLNVRDARRCGEYATAAAWAAHVEAELAAAGLKTVRRASAAADADGLF